MKKDIMIIPLTIIILYCFETLITNNMNDFILFTIFNFMMGILIYAVYFIIVHFNDNEKKDV